MASEKLNPAAGGAGRARECRKRTAFDGSEHKPAIISLQELRARVLARRYGLKPSLAYVVAALAFQTRER
jgi:hypothetical protein